MLKHFGLVTTTTAAAAADSSSVSRNGTGSSSAAASLSSPSAGRGGPEAGLLVGEQEQGQERQREGAASVEEEAERALWAGGCSVLLQTGDLVDRGPHSLELLSLMHRLQVSPSS